MWFYPSWKTATCGTFFWTHKLYVCCCLCLQMFYSNILWVNIKHKKIPFSLAFSRPFYEHGSWGIKIEINNNMPDNYGFADAHTLISMVISTLSAKLFKGNTTMYLYSNSCIVKVLRLVRPFVRCLYWQIVWWLVKQMACQEQFREEIEQFTVHL